MRFLILLFLIFALSCGGVTESVAPEKSVVGSWKLMGMSKTPVEIARVTETDFLAGRLNFKTDGTFDGEIIYPRSPNKNLRVSGTYRVENDILTISNETNRSVTKSKLKFEKDLMIAAPLNSSGLIMSLKRIN